MNKDKRFELRISQELLDYGKNNSENLSRFIREAIRDKIESALLTDSSLSFIEIRARTPYTFYATFDRAVDGDTICVNIDLGFHLNLNLKLRLIGINTEPIETIEGKKAKDFVEKELQDSHLVIETRKKEKSTVDI